MFRAFYDDYHRYLKAQGVDGVKVDVQSIVNCVGNGFGGSVALARAYHKALSKSIATHFPDEVLPKIAIHSFLQFVCYIDVIYRINFLQKEICC